MKALIFLDVDGVLIPCTKEFVQTRRRWQELIGEKRRLLFDPVCVGMLNALTSMTGAEIVVHSAWRHFKPTFKEMRKFFQVQGITGRIIGRTPEWAGSTMEEEINRWQHDHAMQLNYLIIDDSSPINTKRAHYLQTESEVGFSTHELLTKAMKMLLPRPSRDQ